MMLFWEQKIFNESGNDDHENGVQLIGQVQGLVHDVPRCAEIMERVLREAEEARGRVNSVF